MPPATRGDRRSPIARLLSRLGLLGHPDATDEPVPLARQICRTREGRLITAALFLLIGVAAAPFGLLLGGPEMALRLGAVGLVGLAAGAVIALLRTSEIHPVWFDVLCLVIGGLLALGVAAAQPYGGTITPLFTFLGPAVAFVIIRPRARLLHALAGSLLILVPFFTWSGTDATMAASVLSLGVTWGLGLFVALVWDGADRQTRRLEELVRADPLTGVGNRRLLDERLRYELRRHARTRGRLTLVALDLNGFKQVNDALGHHAGDELLCRVATTLRAAVREQDTVVRAGGDEFCVLSPGTDRDAARALVAKLHRALDGIEAGPHAIAAAIGAAVFPDDATEPADLLETADARQRADKAAPAPRDAVPAAEAVGPPARRGLRLPGLRGLAEDLEEAFLAADPGLPDGDSVARRVTRLPRVRTAAALAFAGIGVGCLVGSAWFADRTPEMLALAAMTLVTGAAVRLVPTDRMDARWFGALPVVITVELAAGLLLLGDQAYTAYPIAVFIGAGAAFVLSSGRAVAAHLTIATIVLGAAAVSIGTAPVLTGFVCGWAAMVWHALYVRLTWRGADEQSVHLGELMRRDPLTGVGNRRLLTERVEYEVRRHTRSGTPLTVFALDLNGFKQINDTLGHAAGDDLLRDAARALQRAVRAQDTIVRQGGDEFALIAPETGPEEARTLARALRAALAQVRVSGEPLTAGIGFATYPDDAEDAAALMHAADIRQLADKPAGARHGRPAGAHATSPWG